MEDSHLKDKKMDDVLSRRLSLIDLLLEDDSLIGLVPGFLQDDHSSSENQEQRSVELFEFGANQLVDFDDTLKQKEQVPQRPECAEPIRKYNSRNSFSWNIAFFTGEGLLDDEKLASLITVENGEKHVFPEIQEEVHRSADSTSTLESDTSRLKSSKACLFKDVRAPIQKSSSGMCKTKASCTSKRGNLVSQDKMKPKVAPNKPSISMQNPPKLARQVSASRQIPQMKPKVATNNPRISMQNPPKLVRQVSASRQIPQMKPKVVPNKPSISSMQNPQKLARQVSASPQIPQSLAGSRESASSLLKRPKVLEKPSSISTTAAKRASLSVRGAPLSKLPSSSRVPRPALPSKSSSSSSSATRIESTSLFQSSGGISSLKFGTSLSNSTKKKTDYKTGNIPTSSASNPKAPSRIVVKNKSQPGKSNLSAHLMCSSKLSASTLPASSTSNRSSESVSSLSSSSRKSFNRSSCKRVCIDCDAPHASASQNHRDDESSVGQESQVSGLVGQCALRASAAIWGLPPASKPSGLRLPKPKIGFFDGLGTPSLYVNC